MRLHNTNHSFIFKFHGLPIFYSINNLLVHTLPYTQICDYLSRKIDTLLN